MTEQDKVRMFTLVFDKRSGVRKSILVVRGLGSISILLCNRGNVSAFGFLMIT